MKAIIAAALIVAVAGCAAPATRDTWNSQTFTTLQLDHQTCLVEANKPALPIVAVGPARRTLYKDCMEQHGYTKLATDQVPSTETTLWSRPFVIDSACLRHPNQTCMVFSAQCATGIGRCASRVVLP